MTQGKQNIAIFVSYETFDATRTFCTVLVNSLRTTTNTKDAKLYLF